MDNSPEMEMTVFEEAKSFRASLYDENNSSSITITESESLNDERGLLLRGVVNQSFDS